MPTTTCEHERVLILDDAGVKELPTVIRDVCEASGEHVLVKVPGLGEVVIFRKDRIGDLVRLFQDEEFAATLERGATDFLNGRGATYPAGVAPGDEFLPLRDKGIADSIERGSRDFIEGNGTVRRRGSFPE